ncbi:response regulator [Aquabacterium sp. A7-Y]|uniref:response regulator n=1 Tax=Aquabacterium sp. A7-Y TaxID=1349605 RepID=UPI00223CEF95|nr:response regulator [Aquabacterium sp. A7-Y]MCW7536943.1 response regulator [Aquabacterium sp. A7-Y]
MDSNKPVLLFVDDEPAILVALRVVFRSNYEVVTTTDPEQAVELLKTRRFDVIVSDQRMPGMAGVALLREACELSPETTRLLLTGYSDTGAMVDAINDGEVYRYVQKPWDNGALKALVDEAVEVARRLRGPCEGSAAGEFDELSPTAARAAGPDQAPAAGTGKEVVLVVDPHSSLYSQARRSIAMDVEFVPARNLNEVLDVMGRSPVGVMVCAFDVQNEADCRVLQSLKQQYPHLLVIAVCDSMDSSRLIDLINRAKVFRFVKNPVPWALLTRYIASAVAHVRELRRNPALLYRQAPQPAPAGALRTSVGTPFPAGATTASPRGAFGGGRSLGSYLAKVFGLSKRR